MRHDEFVKQLLQHKFLLPPLAGFTDHPYRNILASFSPPFICTEMISSEAINHRNPKTLRMLTKSEGTHLSGVQLVGSDTDSMCEAAGFVESLGYDYVDINMGCTVGTIIRNGAGIALMKDEEKAAQLVSKIVSAINIPVTCKIRLGTTSTNQNAVSLSKKLEKAGVTAITVHGRNGEKKYGMPVNLNGIKKVVDNIDVPIIANGGVFSGKDAFEILEKTGVSAIMPGRGIIGNPWLITEIKAALAETAYNLPTLGERKTVCLRHLYELCKFYGAKDGVVKMRRIIHRYFPNTSYLRELKNHVHVITTVEEVQTLLSRIKLDGPYTYYSRI